MAYPTIFGGQETTPGSATLRTWLNMFQYGGDFLPHVFITPSTMTEAEELSMYVRGVIPGSEEFGRQYYRDARVPFSSLTYGGDHSWSPVENSIDHNPPPYIPVPDMSTKKKNPQPAKKMERPMAIPPRKPRARTPPAPKAPVTYPMPASVGSSFVMGKPTFRSAGSALVISHCEYSIPVYGSVAFTTTPSSINPGNINLFPWLSTIASRFESYVFEALEFMYAPACSSATSGSVYIGVDYNTSDAPPSSIYQFSSYEGFVNTSSFIPRIFSASQQNLSKRKTYFVTAGVISGNDTSLSDTGNLFVATEDQGGVAKIGSLYVRYRVRFTTPEMETATGSNARSSRYTGTSNAAVLGTKTQIVAGQTSSMPTVGRSPFIAVATGTTASVVTFTALYNWTGYLTIAMDGTGLTAQNVTGTTATIAGLGQGFNSPTSVCTLYTLIASPGQVIVVNTTNTTITSSDFVFAEASFPL